MTERESKNSGVSTSVLIKKLILITAFLLNYNMSNDQCMLEENKKQGKERIVKERERETERYPGLLV